MTGLEIRDRPVHARAHLPIDPRIAARWESVRRAQSQGRRRAAVGVTSVITAVVATWLAAHSSILAVHHVVVRGGAHTGRDNVLAAARLDRRPMLDVDLAGVRRRVLALPWVGRVSVQKRWPTTVAIDIAERSPLAQVAGTAGQPAVVDADGRVLAVGADASRLVGPEPGALATLQGVPVATQAGTTLAPSARGALKVLQALRAAPAEHRSAAPPFTVRVVTRAADGTVSASLSPGAISAIFGSTDQLDAKLVALRSVLAQLAASSIPGSATIDVRVAEAPVLTEGKKSS